MADSSHNTHSAIQVHTSCETRLRGALRHPLNGLKVEGIDFTFLKVCVSVVNLELEHYSVQHNVHVQVGFAKLLQATCMFVYQAMKFAVYA